MVLWALLLAALNLRPGLTSLGPVLPEAMEGMRLTATQVSFLTTLPVLLLGLTGPLAATLAARLGGERVVLIMLFVLATGCGIRVLGSFEGLLAASVLIGCSIGIIGTLLPGFIKRDFSDKVAVTTGLYTTALALGAAAAAGLMIPLQQALGKWQLALAFWALPPILAMALWVSAESSEAADWRRAAIGRELWLNSSAWLIALFMGLQSLIAYVIFGWLAAVLRDRGMPPGEAGLAVSLSVLAQAVACLSTPSLAVRFRDQRMICIILCIVTGTGIIACFFGPLRFAWASSLVLGLGQGGLFAMALLLVILRSPTPQVAAQLSGMSQGVGYTLAAGGPLLVGMMRDWTGSWSPVGIALVATVLLTAATGFSAGSSVPVLEQGRESA